MKTTALYFVTMLFLPVIFSVRISADRFSEIKTEIANFCNSIEVERAEANSRYLVEKEWCNQKIREAEELIVKRKKEIEAIEAQKKGLEDKIDDNKKAIAHYQDKYQQNNSTMARFKIERCDANFNFIVLLREHYDAEELLRQLKADLDKYLDAKIADPLSGEKLPTSFIERVSSIGHLLPADQQTAFVQMVQAAGYVQAGDVTGVVNDSLNNRYDARTVEDTLHVDNTRQELQALEHVKVINPVEYFTKLKAKIDNIIDGLISHLVSSREDISMKEMKSNEDYAAFMIALDKENAELLKMIAQLEAENVELDAQLTKTVVTLEEFRVLLKAAEDNLAYLKAICEEKEQYHAREEERRNREKGQCDEAAKIFEEIVGSDEELKKLLNGEGDLKKSDILEKRATFEQKSTDNKAADIKIVF